MLPVTGPRRRMVAAAALALVAILVYVRVSSRSGDGPAIAHDDEAMALDPAIFAVVVKERLDDVEMAWPFAEVTITVARVQEPGVITTTTLLADEEGRAAIDLLGLWEEAGRPRGGVMLTAAAALDGKELHTEPLRRDVSPGDISAMGYQAAGAGEFERAVLIFRRLLMRAPEDGPLWAALADASAKAGRPIESLFAWREALRSGPDVARSREIRELCVDITERLQGEPPPPTLDAVTLLTEAQEQAKLGELERAASLASAAQEEAPWWREAYELGGAMRVALVLQRLGNSEPTDLDDWDLKQAIVLHSDVARATRDGIETHLARVAALREAEAEFNARRAEVLESLR